MIQTTCNYIGLLLNNANGALYDHDSAARPQGSWITMMPMGGPIGTNSEGGPASAPADGPPLFGGDPTNNLHTNPYPYVGAPGQNGVCLAGVEDYVVGRTVLGNPPGQTPTTRYLVPRRLLDPLVPQR